MGSKGALNKELLCDGALVQEVLENLKEEVTVTQEKRGRAFWISGAMEARVKSCPRSGGSEGQRGLTGDMEEATDVDGLVNPMRSLCLFQKALGDHGEV